MKNIQQSQDIFLMTNRSCDQKIQNISINSDTSQQPVCRTAKSQKQNSQNDVTYYEQAIQQQWLKNQQRANEQQAKPKDIPKKRHSGLIIQQQNTKKQIRNHKNLDFGAEIVKSQIISLKSSILKEQRQPSEVEVEAVREQTYEWPKIKTYLGLGFVIGVVSLIYWFKIKRKQ